jgi:hypothetical protein
MIMKVFALVTDYGVQIYFSNRRNIIWELSIEESSAFYDGSYDEDEIKEHIDKYGAALNFLPIMYRVFGDAYTFKYIKPRWEIPTEVLNYFKSSTGAQSQIVTQDIPGLTNHSEYVKICNDQLKDHKYISTWTSIHAEDYPNDKDNCPVLNTMEIPMNAQQTPQPTETTPEMIIGFESVTSTGKKIVYDPFPKGMVPFRLIVDMVPETDPDYKRFQNAVRTLSTFLMDPRFGRCAEIGYTVETGNGTMKTYKTPLLTDVQGYIVTGRLSVTHAISLGNFFYEVAPAYVKELGYVKGVDTAMEATVVTETADESLERVNMAKQLQLLNTMYEAKALELQLEIEKSRTTTDLMLNATQSTIDLVNVLRRYDVFIELLKPTLDTSKGELLEIVGGSGEFSEVYGNSILPVIEKIPRMAVYIPVVRLASELHVIMQTLHGVDVADPNDSTRTRREVIKFYIEHHAYDAMGNKHMVELLRTNIKSIANLTDKQVNILLTVADAVHPLPKMREGKVYTQELSDTIWVAYVIGHFSTAIDVPQFEAQLMEIDLLKDGSSI